MFLVCTIAKNSVLYMYQLQVAARLGQVRIHLRGKQLWKHKLKKDIP